MIWLLLLILIGGPAVMLTPFWLGHITSERHANATAEAIRRRQLVDERPKAVTR